MASTRRNRKKRRGSSRRRSSLRFVCARNGRGEGRAKAKRMCRWWRVWWVWWSSGTSESMDVSHVPAVWQEWQIRRYKLWHTHELKPRGRRGGEGLPSSCIKQQAVDTHTSQQRLACSPAKLGHHPDKALHATTARPQSDFPLSPGATLDRLWLVSMCACVVVWLLTALPNNGYPCRCWKCACINPVP